MTVSVCPVATVMAPVETVWDILTQPAHYETWADAQLQSTEPDGLATVGQTTRFTSMALGITWPIVFRVEDVATEAHRIALLVTLPLGMSMRPVISCIPFSPTTCRVQYG